MVAAIFTGEKLNGKATKLNSKVILSFSLPGLEESVFINPVFPPICRVIYCVI